MMSILKYLPRYHLLSCIHIYRSFILMTLSSLSSFYVPLALYEFFIIHILIHFFNEIVVSRCETVCVNGVLPHVTDTNKLHKNAPV